MNIQEQPQIVKDLWYMVNYDRYAWIPIWGEARSGKTTLALLLMYKIYLDWDDVLAAIIFNLSQLIYKMRKGKPRLFPTLTKPVHMRIPVLLWDDFAAHSGKAQTQHEKAWDKFKGAFDTLGTRIGVLLATMVNPRSPTQQIMEKYTHEVLVEFGSNGKRIYKYDKCKQQQDYYGWKTRQNKDWLEQQEFGKVPLDVFTQYDEMRTSLVDEVFVSMEDSMAEDTIEGLKKKVEQVDLQLLRLIKQRGPIHYHKLKDELGQFGKKALIRCKARQLVTPVRRSETYYVYDLTSLGFDLLRSLDVAQTSQSSKHKINL